MLVYQRVQGVAAYPNIFGGPRHCQTWTNIEEAKDVISSTVFEKTPMDLMLMTTDPVPKL